MTKEYLILVDMNDNPIGSEEKVACHLPNGKLHRAFTILLFSKNGRLLITRRSKHKMLWPGGWDGTVASHPRQSETYVSSAERRLPEEIGISCKLEYLFKFEYHVPYKNIGSENEICGTLVGLIEEDTKFNLVPEEIDATKWISFNELYDKLDKSPENFCPWMILALYLLPHSKKDVSEYIRSILTTWNNKDFNHVLEKATHYHFPDKKWEIK